MFREKKILFLLGHTHSFTMECLRSHVCNCPEVKTSPAPAPQSRLKLKQRRLMLVTQLLNSRLNTRVSQYSTVYIKCSICQRFHNQTTHLHPEVLKHANYRRSLQKSRREIELCWIFLALLKSNFFAVSFLLFYTVFQMCQKSPKTKARYENSTIKLQLSNLCRKLLHEIHFPKIDTYICFRRSKHYSHLPKRTFSYVEINRQLPNYEQPESLLNTATTAILLCMFTKCSVVNAISSTLSASRWFSQSKFNEKDKNVKWQAAFLFYYLYCTVYTVYSVHCIQCTLYIVQVFSYSAHSG